MQKKTKKKDVFFAADQELIDAINQPPRLEEVKRLTMKPSPRLAKMVIKPGAEVARELEADESRERSRKSQQPKVTVRVSVRS